MQSSDILLRSASLNTPGQTVDIQCDGNHAADRDDLLIGLQWDFYPGTKPVDLDASAVCFDNLGVVQDAVYYNQLTAFSGAVTHSGDSLDGSGDGFDETISFDVDKLPLNVHMIAIIVNAHDEGTDFTDVESASCILQDFPLSAGGSPRTLADISIGCKGKNTGIVLCILIRGGSPRKWTVKAAGELCPSGRNFNECMPSIRKCIDANLEDWVKDERTLDLEKTFNMKKGDNAIIPNELSQLCVGLGWDCASSVDLDASVIVLCGSEIPNNASAVETCSYSAKEKYDWGLRHTGDNTTGAGSGDDETIRIDLAQAARRGGIGTSLIITVNVYSEGKTFDRSVHNAYIRIYAPQQQNKTLAIYWLSDGAVTTRGLLFAELHRRDARGWSLEALGIGCGGKNATASETQNAAKNATKSKSKNNGQNSSVKCSSQSKRFLEANSRGPKAPVNPNRRMNNGTNCCIVQ
jgi:stress response protein SCP2